MKYAVILHDVDGKGRYVYKTLAKAKAKFEEMVGPADGHISEAYWELADKGAVLPTFECLTSLRGVGMYGNVAYFRAVDDEAILKARAAWAAAGVAKLPAAAVAREAGKALEAAYPWGYRSSDSQP